MRDLQKNIPLAPHTTIGLGGPARFFVSCHTTQEVIEAIEYARKQNIPFHILGGGSNTIFNDDGFDGLIIHIQLKGIAYADVGDDMQVTAAAGEEWDAFVLDTIAHGLGGIECLSGIPGLVGATPIQNVGAYGQEVAQTITSVQVLDVDTLQEATFTNEECAFAYRTSRFKKNDGGKYVVLSVTFALQKDATPTIAYEQVAQLYEERYAGQAEQKGVNGLLQVRDLVLELRRKKSMVVDVRDPHSRSCGSFFVNPIVSKDIVQSLEEKVGKEIPTFPSGDSVKVSAAWLIEQAGFPKGFMEGSVGVSANHTLALVNYKNATSVELLSFAKTITDAVQEMFGIQLEQEPVVISS